MKINGTEVSTPWYRLISFGLHGGLTTIPVETNKVGLIRSITLWNTSDQNINCNITEIIVRYSMIKSDKEFKSETMVVQKNINN